MKPLPPSHPSESLSVATIDPRSERADRRTSLRSLAFPDAIPPTMADPALTTALTNITAILSLLQQQQAAAPVAAPTVAPTAVLTLFDDGTPFDMSSRSGSTAMSLASSPLSSPWDGSVLKLPSFLASLKKRAHEAKWYAPAPFGILTFPPHDLLSAYHSVDLPSIELAATARTNPRAKQNSLAMFKCLSDSLSGDLKTQFDQEGNLPSNEGGPTLFKLLTELTVAASTLLSIQALDDLQSLEPAEFLFSLPALNARINSLFTLATTNARTLSDGERMQMVLRIYRRIRQPAAWCTWVSNRSEALDNQHSTPLPGLPNLKHIALMNGAVLYAVKLSNDKDYPVSWKSTTMEQDVVAMVASAARPPPVTAPPPAATPSRPRATGSSSTSTTTSRRGTASDLPPFARHFKTSGATDAPHYSVGDTKLHEGVTWHFCDAVHPHNSIRWHSYPASQCRDRTRWIAAGSPPRPPSTRPAIVALATDDPSTSVSALTIPTTAPPLPSSHSSDITALLAHALSLPDATDAARAFIADALNAVHHQA